jgi:hypothetical protein
MPISLPASHWCVRASFGLEANTQSFGNPFNKNQQRLILSPGIWTATYTIRRMRKNEQMALDFISFFLQCQGMANTFDAYDPDRRTPQGIATGTPLVKGANQSGNTLAIDGCTPSTAVWLKAGDYFSVNGEMKQLTANASTNGSGETTLTFQPPLRSKPADNAPLTVTGVTCTMILTDDRQGIWEADVNGIYDEKTFSAVEVF